jgi:glycosyltransferase involved in cell wall biosynthesis
MKVLHVINNLGSGGAESMLINFFKQLPSSSDVYEILLLVDDTISFKKLPSHIKITTLSKSKKRYSLKKTFSLYHFIKKGSFDVIHAHLFPSQYYVFFIKLFFNENLKIITTEHNTTNSRRRYWLLRLIDNFIYSKYDKIIFISQGVKKQFSKDYPMHINKGIIITNGIPLDQYFPKKNTEDYSKEIKIIMVASFSKQKDHETLIKAMCLLSDRHTLSLVGEGKRINEMKVLTKSLNIEKRVKFLGFRNDIAKLYRKHDIFVLSSHWEGFGLVAAEAMASGLPVIASKVDGLKEIVDGAGLLFETGNKEELALQINKISNNKELKKNLIKEGLKRAITYDIKNLVINTLHLYKEIIK